MKRSIIPGIPSFKIITFALLALATVPAPGQTLPCIETNSSPKFVAPPNVDGGLDVKDSRNGIVLADDFQCTSTGKVTDIHIWGSWLSDQHGIITNFWIGIYSDVSATTNGTIITPSHPGNLLWYQDFGANYSESPGPAGSEYFYNPTNNLIMGGDTQAWYYCFFPTNPFVQQGTINNPTNYWLAVRAQLADQTSLFGWKSSTYLYHDAAVWGTIDATGFPSGNWQSMTNPFGGPLNLSMMLTTPTNPPPRQPCCPETNGVKWAQGPDLVNGIDYNASLPFTLADDFLCTNAGPITDIHLWGSWLNNLPDYGATYTLAIWSDVPTNIDITYSHPGTLLWAQPFGPGSYTICPDANLFEPFDNPDGTAMGTTTNLYYICFNVDPANAFPQTGTQSRPTNYWLSVTVQPSTGNGQPFGWKSSTNIFNDRAVWSPVAFPPPTGSWIPINPSSPTHVDLAFKITTLTNNPPPVVCGEGDYEKTVQWPNIYGGFDVWNNPYVLADDFVCTNTGPISDIHLWGSWWYDLAQTNSITFWLGIYDDVKAGPGNPFSHPGTNLLWQQWFAPGQYAETIWTANAIEQFLDPGLTNILGPDSVVWYYCFYPTNAFQQLGGPTNHITYWLAAYAQLPAGSQNQYGWKTTTNVLNDASVHAPWPGGPPTSNPGWTPTVYSLPATGQTVPLDLAFKLTMCGTVKIQQFTPTSVMVTWPGGGCLQSATNVTGPYIDILGCPASPYIDSSVIPPTNRFYRVRCN